MPRLDSIYRGHAAHWQSIYDAIGAIYGTAYQILNFGDQLRAGKVNSTAFEARGAIGGTVPSVRTWTWGPAAPYANDDPFDLTNPKNWLGHIPILALNGTDEEADTLDDGFFSRASAVFSVGGWVNLRDAANSVFLAKWNATSASPDREWKVLFAADATFQFILYDDNANAQLGRLVNSTTAQNVWIHIFCTYSGSGTNGGMKLYKNGIQADDANGNSGAFVNMVAGGTKPSLGFETGPSSNINLFDGKMLGGPLGPVFVLKELSAAEILELYYIGAQATGLK